MSSIYDEGERINKANEEKVFKERRDLIYLLDTLAGRKFIFGILEDGYIFTTTFTKSSQVYYDEGKRSMALKWFNAVLDIDPFIFAKMCREFRNKNE